MKSQSTITFSDIASLQYKKWRTDVEDIFTAITNFTANFELTHKEIIDRMESVTKLRCMLASYAIVNTSQHELVRSEYKKAKAELIAAGIEGKNEEQRTGNANVLLQEYVMTKDIASRIFFKDYKKDLKIDIVSLSQKLKHRQIFIDEVTRISDERMKCLMNQGSLLKDEKQKIQYGKD